jgi:hypothetical protein
MKQGHRELALGCRCPIEQRPDEVVKLIRTYDLTPVRLGCTFGTPTTKGDKKQNDNSQV